MNSYGFKMNMDERQLDKSSIITIKSELQLNHYSIVASLYYLEQNLLNGLYILPLISC